MEKPLPPDILANVTEIIAYALGLLSNWIVRLLKSKPKHNAQK